MEEVKSFGRVLKGKGKCKISQITKSRQMKNL